MTVTVYFTLSGRSLPLSSIALLNFAVFTSDVERSHTEMKQGRVDVSNPIAPYGTGLLTYTEENFNKLLNLCNYNILNNKDSILQALRTAVERRKRFKNCLAPQSSKRS